MSNEQQELKDFVLGFTFDEKGRIKDAGKFEGETLATPYYYSEMMDGGGGDETVTDGDTTYDYFYVEDKDVRLLTEWSGVDFGWLKDKSMFRVYTRDDGFTIGQQFTQDEFFSHSEKARSNED